MRIHEPIDESEMLNQKHIGEHSICQTLRNIYFLADNLKADKEHLKWQARLAMSMAKSMNRKLKQYKKMMGEIDDGV